MDDKELGDLQDTVLECVLSSSPLPGQPSPISFPDLAYVTQSEEKLLLDVGYFGQTTHATVVSEEELEQRCSAGEVGYLRFEPPLEESGNITIRLRVFLRFPDVGPLPLGELVVTFAERGGIWTTVPPTHAVAF